MHECVRSRHSDRAGVSSRRSRRSPSPHKGAQWQVLQAGQAEIPAACFLHRVRRILGSMMLLGHSRRYNLPPPRYVERWSEALKQRM